MKRRRFSLHLVAVAICSACLAAQPVSACSSRAVSDIFSYEARTQAILDVEAAMARAQAAEGYIPNDAAQEITWQARAELIPETEFAAERAVVRHRMVALLNVWRRRLSPQASQYVHFGATTVDIYNTVTVMQVDTSLDEIDACLIASVGEMESLASDHKATVMIGRTLGQHAQPITFGKKVGAWIGEYRRHRERLGELRARLRRSAILKGAVGNYSGLGPKAMTIEQRFAAELGFDTPYASDWHGTRDVIAEYGLLMGLIAKSHARIGQEIFLLQSTDIGELRESLPPGTVGSSSMPHKRNPVLPERLIHSGRSIPRLGEVLGDDVVNFYERDNTSRLAPTVEDISVQSAVAARSLSLLLTGLEVDAAAMRANIDRTGGYAMSQRVAFALAGFLPRTEAEAVVKDIIRRSAADGESFSDALNDDARVSAHLSASRIARLLDPEQIEPQAIAQTEATIAARVD